MKFGIYLALIFLFSSVAVAQDRNSPDEQPHITPKNMPQPKENAPPDISAGEAPVGESSSKDSQIDTSSRRTSKPAEDAGGADDAQEMRPYDPHKAAKDVEVGQYYLKQKNYRAALERFNDALLYKPKDAEATIGLAQTQDKLGLSTPAYENYHAYLEILPNGPLARQAQEGIKRLEPAVQAQKESPELEGILKEGQDALARNDFETAYARFARASQMAPDNAMVNFHLAESLVGMQRLDEARLFFQKSLDLQPNGPHAREAKRQIAEIRMVLGK